MSFVTENWQALVVVLLAISEFLSLMPGLKSNSILQLVMNVLESLSPEKEEE